MGVPSQSLEGVADHKLDTKYRVAVPAAWRPASGQSVQLRLLRWKHLKVPVLRAMTHEAFEALIESIATNGDVPTGIRNAQKQAVYGESTSVTLNDQGKLTVPKRTAEDFGFEAGGAVHLIGRGRAFDLVSPAHMEELREKEREILESLYDSVDFG
ncbi:hypothetical protein [Roseibacillus ishigakijimensis]|uniref:SpoVT-AbrB domain-containing protein n=1 Tax=Roseibacillus ishigakijimensis TaxID=454146 RepID=A0A934VNH6_9BACT|nr:hypothetical protein [Roseibacillus ishigakijimensis]MBK1835307.1 hypothetical protein [Roseibacillus ishigakijimensis]